MEAHDLGSRRPLGLAVTPQGCLRLQSVSDSIDAEGIGEDAALRIREAFSVSEAAGLLHLATREGATELSPSLAFGRRLGASFLDAVCGLPSHAAAADEVRRIQPPADLVGALVDDAPPMLGSEYVSEELVTRSFSLMAHHLADQIGGGELASVLERMGGGWHALGRVWFHVAINKDSDDRPFAFLATYTIHRPGHPPRHAPVGRALDELEGQRDALLRLLAPVQRAAEKSPVVEALLDSGEIFHPIAWTSEDARRFLAEAELLEGTGVMLRLPKEWQGKRPKAPSVAILVGESKVKVGRAELLAFDVAVTLDGAPLTEAEKRMLLRGAARLELLRGQWVEVDPSVLRETLDRWKEAGKTISFADGLKLVAGADDRAQHATVVAGAWFEDTLRRLRDPSSPARPSERLRARLRPYQQAGLEWLRLVQELGLGGCLADDMGLGKTVQVIALILGMRDAGERGSCLVVVPASLIGNWKKELERFAPDLEVVVAHRSERAEKITEPDVDRSDVVITTYASLHRNPALVDREHALAVLDEAQAIKNPAARQTKTAKKLRARARLALTGTPIENRLADLWSIFDFLNPGLLGTPAAFARFVSDMKKSDAAYGPLRRLVRPYMLRRKKTDESVVDDLPDKTEVDVYCGLSRVQAALYEESVAKLSAAIRDVPATERRGLILAFLTRFKQICNHPSHWLRDGEFDPKDSGKFLRLGEIADQIAERQEKVLVFTQYREMTEPLRRYLAGWFRREGLILHGGTPVKVRTKLVDAFQADDGPPFFVLSLKAGGTGLNLTRASHVIHFDRWWNPAVEDQATDRAYRIGQHQNVLVHRFVCRGTLEERIAALIADKRSLAEDVLSPGAEKAITELDDQALLALVRLDLRAALEEGE
jgi:non-specific serine/threonine protein kinase